MSTHSEIVWCSLWFFYRMYRTASVALPVVFSVNSLETWKSFKFRCSSLHRHTSVCVTYTLVAKPCQKIMMMFCLSFSQVYMTTEIVFHDETVLVYLMWQYCPIYFLYTYPLVTEVCVFHMSNEDAYFSGTVCITHTLQYLSFSTHDTSKLQKRNISWCMADIAIFRELLSSLHFGKHINFQVFLNILWIFY